MIRFGLHGYGEFDAECGIGPSCWPHFDLLFIHEGHVAIEVQRRADEIELQAGGSVLLYPQTPFRGYSVCGRTRASVMHFAFDAGRDHQHPPFERLLKLRNGFEINSAEAGKRAEPDVHRAMKLAQQNGSDLLYRLRAAVLTLVLAELCEAHSTTTTDEVMGDFGPVMVWAQEHLVDRPTVESLAERAGLSTSHFRSRFLAETGLSAGAYLKELRIRETSRLLRETRMPLKQIAHVVGYTDVSTLYHAFRQRNQMSPAAYRRKHTLMG